MDFKKYLEFIDYIDVGSTNLLFIMKIKDNDNKVKRYLISSRDLAVLLKLDSYIDTSLQSIVKKAMLGEDTGYSFDGKINDYLIPEHMYDKYRKKTISSIYKQYFDKAGHQKGNPVYFYTWGEYLPMLSYLIDHYAIIRLHDLDGLIIRAKPCCCKSVK